MKFLSQEWIDAFEVEGKKMFAPGVTPTKLTISLTEAYENIPADHVEGGYFWHQYIIKDGILTDINYGYTEDTVPNSDYVIYGDYGAYMKVLSGEVALAKAAVSGMFTIEGNMLKAMKMFGTYEKLMDVKKQGGKTEW